MSDVKKRRGIVSRGEKPIVELIFEKHVMGACGVDIEGLDVERAEFGDGIVGKVVDLPEVGQMDVVRHYTQLAKRNFSVDENFYPLGSCTMKYNPRINEVGAGMSGVVDVHPLSDDSDVQGLLELLYELGSDFAEISGLDEVSLQPCAGAHGEWTALKVIRAYYNDLEGGNAPERRNVLVPDTAHGTNFASCAMCGCKVVKVGSKEGLVDLDDLRKKCDEKTAVMMITNPNTSGLFDGQIVEIADIVHGAGGLVYLDGANMNAILGVARPGDFGVDAMHFNVHKTFSTPHGCGGPGAGPIVVRDFLGRYLPRGRVVKRGDGFELDWGSDGDGDKSIGRVRSFFGQVGVLVRAWCYIRACGGVGLRRVSETAVLNANYVATRLAGRYEMPFFDNDEGRYCAHEFITVPRGLLERGVALIDIAKRLIDYGIHPPTMHWPVHDCLMIEPTETESKGTLDRFVEVMLNVADEVEADVGGMKESPREAVIGRLDEVSAARSPRLSYVEGKNVG